MPRHSDAWPRPGSLDELIAVQSGVAARAQLLAVGVQRQKVLSQVRTGRWRIAGRQAVVLHSGPLSDIQRLWVAVINAGPRSALCGPTAATLDGLTGFETTAIHVMLPPGPAARDTAGVVVHRSRHFDPSTDVHPVRRPPRTRVARSAVDAARWDRRPDRACAILAATVQQGLATPAQLRDALTRCRPDPRRSLLLAIIGDLEGGAQSFAEINAARLCRQAGLPEPERQAIRTDSDGKRRYLDLFWPSRNLCVEIDGGFHRRVVNWQRDMDRQNDLVASGVRILRFPVATVRLTPGRFVAQIGRALAA